MNQSNPLSLSYTHSASTRATTITTKTMWIIYTLTANKSLPQHLTLVTTWLTSYLTQTHTIATWSTDISQRAENPTNAHNINLQCQHVQIDKTPTTYKYVPQKEWFVNICAPSKPNMFTQSISFVTVDFLINFNTQNSKKIFASH